MRRQRIPMPVESATCHLESYCADDDVATGTVLVLPGADCAAERYRWLAEAFTPLGLETFIIDPPVSQREALLRPGNMIHGQFVSPVHLQAALAWLADFRNGRPVVLVGHSLGGVVTIEWLDQDEAMRNPLNRDVRWRFELADHVVAAVTMGSTLQRQALGVTFPWRSEDRALTRPRQLPVLMLAGENDGLASPALVAATALRYQPPISIRTLPGICHFGWVEGRASTDRIDLDGQSGLPTAEQRQLSVVTIGEFLRPILERYRANARARG